MNFEGPPKDFKVKPEDYESTGKEFLEENIFNEKLSKRRKEDYEDFERRFGMPGIMHHEFIKQVETGPGDYDCYHLKRLYGEIDGSRVDIVFREFSELKEDEGIKKMVQEIEVEGGEFGNTNLYELFEQLPSKDTERWKEKIKEFIETYGRYSRGEQQKLESAKMLSDANAVMYKLEKGMDFLSKHKEK